MKKYTKLDFYRLVYEKNGCRYPLDDVTWIVKAVFKCMEDILKDGDMLTIPESFSLKRILKGDRTTGNFGKPMKIPARYEPFLKPSARWIRICKAMEVKEEFEEQDKSKKRKRKIRKIADREQND